MRKFKLDKSKGLAFSVEHPITGEQVDFYKGLYSEASRVAEVDGREIYLCSPGCLLSTETKDFPENYARRELFRDYYKHRYPHIFDH